MPLFLAQGDADVILRPAVTYAFMARQCAAESKVMLNFGANIGHGWIAARFAGPSVLDGCGGRRH